MDGAAANINGRVVATMNAVVATMAVQRNCIAEFMSSSLKPKNQCFSYLGDLKLSHAPDSAVRAKSGRGVQPANSPKG
jgi:hypothetical protein